MTGAETGGLEGTGWQGSMSREASWLPSQANASSANQGARPSSVSREGLRDGSGGDRLEGAGRCGGSSNISSGSGSGSSSSSSSSSSSNSWEQNRDRLERGSGGGSGGTSTSALRSFISSSVRQRDSGNGRSIIEDWNGGCLSWRRIGLHSPFFTYSRV